MSGHHIKIYVLNHESLPFAGCIRVIPSFKWLNFGHMVTTIFFGNFVENNMFLIFCAFFLIIYILISNIHNVYPCVIRNIYIYHTVDLGMLMKYVNQIDLLLLIIPDQEFR